MKWNMAVVPMLMLALLAPGLPAVEAQEANVQGMVCSDEDCWNHHVPGATVELVSAGVVGGVGSETETTTTAEDGSFSFSGVADGEYTLRVSRQGVEPAERALTVDGKGYAQVTVMPKQVEGTFHVTSYGAAVQDAQISISASDYRDQASGSTNGNGDAALSYLTGHYRINVHADNLWVNTGPLFLDGSRQNVSMEGLGDAIMDGKVVDQDGNPVAGAMLHANAFGYPHMPTPAEPPQEASPDQPQSTTVVREGYPIECCQNSVNTRSRDDGSFRIAMPPGEMSISPAKPGYAGSYERFRLESGENPVTITLSKFPDKTATIEGKVTGPDGQPLRYVSLSIQNQEWGVYECSTYDTPEAQSTQSGSAGGAEPAMTSIAPYPYPGCQIQVAADGTFTAKLTPGYSTINVYHDHWRSCTETHNADGSGSRACGPEYLGYVRTMDLPADATTKLDILLRQRAPADAKVSGYVVDQSTKNAIPGAHVHFNSQEGYSWGNAETDADGSYGIKLRGGPHMVSVYVDGYFHWQGMVDVPAGGEVAFDIFMKEGTPKSGGCCYAYAEDARAEGASSAPQPAVAPGSQPAPASPSGPTAESSSGSAGGSSDGSGGEAYEDLGGGLGPYDPDARANLQEGPSVEPSQESPGVAAVLIGLALLGLAAVRRRP